jgi:hypothetical protein
MGDDEEVKVKALPGVQHLMDSLVRYPRMSDYALILSADNSRRLSRFYSSQEPAGFMDRAQNGRSIGKFQKRFYDLR